MKVPSSEFLESKRPILSALIEALQKKYPFCSVLASDCRAKRYSVSGRGVAVGEDDLFTQRGFVVRVMSEEAYAEYSFNVIDSDSIADITEKIEKQLIPLGSILPDKLTVLKRSLQDEEECTLCASTEYELHPEALGSEAIVEKLSAIREKGKALDSRIIDCVGQVSWQEIHKLYISPKKNMEQNIIWTCGMAAVLALKGGEIKESYKGFSVLGGAEVMDEMEKDIPSIVNTVIELLDSESIVPGEYECICSPSVTGMIVHEAFGHGVEMDMFAKDRALAKSFIGQYVASPLVTMHDGAINASDAGSYFFDDEGTLAHDTVVIENGILKQGISDLLSARTLGTVPTGNGRRESFERKAYTRMTNTYFTGGHDKVEDMIASVKYGFLLDEPTSGMEDPKNWGIQCMVSFAREIKDGKLTGKIFSPIVLTGYVPDLLKSISMMSEDVILEGGGMCGKGHKEWVKVSDGGPYIKARIRLG